MTTQVRSSDLWNLHPGSGSLGSDAFQQWRRKKPHYHLEQDLLLNHRPHKLPQMRLIHWPPRLASFLIVAVTQALRGWQRSKYDLLIPPCRYGMIIVWNTLKYILLDPDCHQKNHIYVAYLRHKDASKHLKYFHSDFTPTQVPNKTKTTKNTKTALRTYVKLNDLKHGVVTRGFDDDYHGTFLFFGLKKKHISRFWPREDTRAVKPISPFFGPSQTTFGARGLVTLRGGDFSMGMSWHWQPVMVSFFFNGDVWVMFVWF